MINPFIHPRRKFKRLATVPTTGELTAPRSPRKRKADARTRETRVTAGLWRGKEPF